MARPAPPGRNASVAAAAVLWLAWIGSSTAFVVGGPQVIPAPKSVLDDAAQGGAFNAVQQAFDEKQGVVLEVELRVDQGTIPKGTCVSSHMIFLNTHESQAGGQADLDVEWVFDGKVLGVMSDYAGLLEAASSALLGAPNTVYPTGFVARGLEGYDRYAIDGNRVRVSMLVSEPGDWIRVVTECSPVSASTQWGAPKTRQRGVAACGRSSTLACSCRRSPLRKISNVAGRPMPAR